jgi:hypothetical protein
LPANGDYLDFDVYDPKCLGADVDLDQAWIDGLVELAEAGDESHGAYQREQTGDEQKEKNGIVVRKRNTRKDIPWRTSLNGLGKGQQGIAPQKPTQDPSDCIIEP